MGLRERLLESVDVAPFSDEYFTKGADDGRWAETQIGEDSPTGRPRVLINHAKFRDAGSSGYEDAIVLSESIHNLKNVDPERYERIHAIAERDPSYMNWAKRSYHMETLAGRSDRDNRERETRPFQQWHDVSRLDQIIGGYIFAGNKSIPTMRNWNRKELPIGAELRGELEALRKDIGQ